MSAEEVKTLARKLNVSDVCRPLYGSIPVTRGTFVEGQLRAHGRQDCRQHGSSTKAPGADRAARKVSHSQQQVKVADTSYTNLYMNNSIPHPVSKMASRKMRSTSASASSSTSLYNNNDNNNNNNNNDLAGLEP
ncbi:unnamed protein product, partial [Amoebophrya sp. A25]|eukprot:GSA25T00004797001.1